MDINFFKETKILDGGMGQELLARGLQSNGTLWSASALIEEKNHKLLVDTHLSFIDAGADVIVTNNFSARRVRLEQNNVAEYFKFANQKAGELAAKAREISKKNVLIAGGLPPQNGTYVVDDRDRKVIEKDFTDQANLINPFVDFFYLDVFSSSWEVEVALNVIEKLNKPVLIGLHLKKNNKIASGETVTEIINKYKNDKLLGVICACVSLEIIENSANEMKNLKIPFGFKANLWSVDEPLPVHKFNDAKPDEIGKNPKLVMGSREEITGKLFYNFAKKISNQGATILGGCCETTPLHIKEISKLK